MKEGVTDFERRTGLRYAPAEAGRALGRPLGPREECPTLFRYPGPEALRDFLNGLLRHLAPGGRECVWLSSDPRERSAQPRGVSLFGCVAVLEPLRLSPLAARPKGLYLGANLPLRRLPGIVWIPPSLGAARIRWDRLRSVDEVLGRAGYAREQASVLERVNRYLEELDALRRAGAPRPRKPWCNLPESARRAALRRHGVRPSWTAA
jgi:hypothetical protein